MRHWNLQLTGFQFATTLPERFLKKQPPQKKTKKHDRFWVHSYCIHLITTHSCTQSGWSWALWIHKLMKGTRIDAKQILQRTEGVLFSCRRSYRLEIRRRSYPEKWWFIHQDAYEGAIRITIIDGCWWLQNTCLQEPARNFRCCTWRQWSSMKFTSCFVDMITLGASRIDMNWLQSTRWHFFHVSSVSKHNILQDVDIATLWFFRRFWGSLAPQNR